VRKRKWLIGLLVAVVLILAIAGSAYAVAGQPGAKAHTNTSCSAVSSGVCPNGGDPAKCPNVDGSAACARAAGSSCCSGK
jgi:hypothetical protein